jgi:oligopeptide transport system permease protein
MRNYVLKRIGISALTLFAILLVLFLLMDLLPGSPFNDERLSFEQIMRLRALYGLDRPWPERFFRYIGNMLSGQFGVSYTIAKNIPVIDLLRTRFPTTVRIGLQAVLLGTFTGILLGIVAAIRHNSIWDRICTLFSIVGVSIPSYVFALVLSYTLGYQLGWFPLLFQEHSAFHSSVLPTISLSLFSMASVARFTRTEMLEVLESDFILLAQSKGVRGANLIVKHVLRNALIPIITVLAPLIVGLMTGSLVIEKIFSVPGIGQLLVTAIQSNDYNVVMTLAFIYSAMYIGIMLVVDVLYGVIDPRIRLAKEAQYE